MVKKHEPRRHKPRAKPQAEQLNPLIVKLKKQAFNSDVVDRKSKFNIEFIDLPELMHEVIKDWSFQRNLIENEKCSQSF